MSIQVCIRAYSASGSSSDRWYKLNTEPQRADFLAVSFKRDWEVVDHEGFGQNLELPGGQDAIVALSRCVEKYGEAFALYASAVGQSYLTISEDGECEDLDEAYRGKYSNKNDYAVELMEEGIFPADDKIAQYVDEERLARDCDIDGSFDEEGDMTKDEQKEKIEEWIEEGLFDKNTLRNYIDIDYVTSELEHDYLIIEGDDGWHVFDRNSGGSGGGYKKNPGSMFKLGKYRVGLKLLSNDSEIAKSVIEISAPNEKSAIGKWNHKYGKHVFEGPAKQTYVFCEKVSSLDMRYRNNPSKKQPKKSRPPMSIDLHGKMKPTDPWFTGTYVEFQLPREIVDSIPTRGSADRAIAEALGDYRVASVINTIGTEKMIKELQQYGAWSREELVAMSKKDEELDEKMLWIACGQIQEEERQ